MVIDWTILKYISRPFGQYSYFKIYCVLIYFSAWTSNFQISIKRHSRYFALNKAFKVLSRSQKQKKNKKITLLHMNSVFLLVNSVFFGKYPKNESSEFLVHKWPVYRFFKFHSSCLDVHRK